MISINQTFKNLKKAKRIGLMTHIVIGYPNIKISEKLVIEMYKSGVDMIELQIPFSDPIADGPVIMNACQKAIKRGFRVEEAFNLIKRLQNKIKIPLLFMTYYNIIFNYGIEKFCKKSREVGIAGLIIPDVPLEEGKEFLKTCKKYSLSPILIMSPTSTKERLKKIGKASRGFVYCVSRTGVTGARTSFNKDLKDFLKRCHTSTSLPLAVGFGVKTTKDIEFLRVSGANIAIIGSQIIRKLNKNGTEGVKKFIKTLLK